MLNFYDASLKINSENKSKINPDMLSSIEGLINTYNSEKNKFEAKKKDYIAEKTESIENEITEMFYQDVIQNYAYLPNSKEEIDSLLKSENPLDSQKIMIMNLIKTYQLYKIYTRDISEKNFSLLCDDFCNLESIFSDKENIKSINDSNPVDISAESIKEGINNLVRLYPEYKILRNQLNAIATDDKIYLIKKIVKQTKESHSMQILEGNGRDVERIIKNKIKKLYSLQ